MKKKKKAIELDISKIPGALAVEGVLVLACLYLVTVNLLLGFVIGSMKGESNVA